MTPPPPLTLHPPSKPLALITGATRRIGFAIAHALASAGFDLILTYRSSTADANSAAAELHKLGSAVRLERLDLAQPDRVSDLIIRLTDELDRLDVLVHNASSYEPTHDTTPLDLSSHTQQLMHINAIAPLMLSLGLAPLIKKSILPSLGSIVALSDIHALGHPRLNHASYAMSKAALTEMVRSLSRDLAPDIRANAIAPGVVAWPTQGTDADPDMQKRYIQRIPLNRPGTPEDAAQVVRWLAMDAAYITGQIITLDGGRSLT